MLALQTWTHTLPIQQQSLLMGAIRGPDGFPRVHKAKELHACYRGLVLNAGKYGRPLTLDDEGDKFMNLVPLRGPDAWSLAVEQWFSSIDELPFHYITHFTDGAQIVGYNYPDRAIAIKWAEFYFKFCKMIHKTPESRDAMHHRLNDWGQEHWSPEAREF